MLNKQGFSGSTSDKEPTHQCSDIRMWVQPLAEIPWRTMETHSNMLPWRTPIQREPWQAAVHMVINMEHSTGLTWQACTQNGSCKHTASPSFAFWNFLDFLKNISSVVSLNQRTQSLWIHSPCLLNGPGCPTDSSGCTAWGLQIH